MSPSGSKSPSVELEVGDRTVRLSNPDRVYFPATGATKLDLVELLPRGRRRDRQRAAGAAVHAAPLPDGRQRREGAPEAGAARRAAVAGDGAGPLPALRTGTPTSCASPSWPSVIWAVQMSTVEFHPWNSRRADTEQPDEWRIDLDPMPRLRRSTRCGGSRTSPTRCSTSSAPSAGRRPPAATGLHVYVRIEPRVGLRRRTPRRAGLRPRGRAARAATTSRPRGGARTATRRALFVDYNQNARDHTIASAYSVRGVPEATVSTPITLGRDRRRRAAATSRSRTVPARFAELGDLHAGIDDAVFASTRCWSGPTATSARARPTPAGRPTFRRASRGDALAPLGRA